MTNSQQIYTLEQGDPERPPTGRPVVYATQGVISSGHYLTSMAGMRMLLTGGNAFDAVAAAAFAAAVVEPIASYSLAGRRRLHALPHRKRRPTVAERAGRRTGQGHHRVLRVARLGRNPYRPRRPGPPLLHRAGNRRRPAVPCRPLRHPHSRRSARALDSLCRARHPQLRIHA